MTHPALIRSATSADVDAVIDLEQACMGSDAWSAGLVREGVTGDLPTVGYLVACEQDTCGYAVASYAGEIAELQRIGVAPARRRTGVAAALLAAVVEEARRVSAERILLEVREDNAPALAFYTSAGFSEINRRRRYYADGATAVVMCLPLVGDEVAQL